MEEEGKSERDGERLPHERSDTRLPLPVKGSPSARSQAAFTVDAIYVSAD